MDLTPEETKKTIELLQACDRALIDTKAEVAIKNHVIEAQARVISTQGAHVVELEKDLNSLYRNPILWFIGGMLVTGVTVRLVK